MKSNTHTPSNIEELLIDTWWFGLTNRLSEEEFLQLAEQRASEGFNAIQLVVGIPPEVAPPHPEARSKVGPAWMLKGKQRASINPEYIAYAAKRIAVLNDIGLTVIVYGGWGMQIEWTGVQFMKAWWAALIQALDELDVIYCVTGEVDLWTSMPNILLPDKSTDNLRGAKPVSKHSTRRLAEKVATKLFHLKTKILIPDADAARKRKWGQVLLLMNKLTQKPIIVHTGGKPGAYSAALIDHPELLAAITVQTGHSQESRNWHWQLPMEHITKDTDRFINLEPWYEGIRDDFWTTDQLFAYWVNILAGACSHTYGAHGIWNVGDGQFLAHWGKQTYTQAKALKTPGLLGLSHQFWRETQGYSPSATTTVDQQEDHLIAIHRDDPKGTPP